MDTTKGCDVTLYISLFFFMLYDDRRYSENVIPPWWLPLHISFASFRPKQWWQPQREIQRDLTGWLTRRGWADDQGDGLGVLSGMSLAVRGDYVYHGTADISRASAFRLIW